MARLQVKKPFGLAIDQQERIWVSNSGSNTVTRFPASDPSKAVEFEVGYSPHAIAIDSQGNAWVANSIGHPGTLEKLAFVEEKIKAKFASHEGIGRRTRRQRVDRSVEHQRQVPRR